MKCYNHPDTSALGICKNCHKGICKSCLTDLGDGLACTASCVQEVEKLNSLVRKTEKTMKSNASQYYTSGIIYIILGGLFLAGPLLIMKRADPIPTTFGAVFVLFGIWRLIMATRYNKDEKPI
jgi:hypothetical protein